MDFFTRKSDNYSNTTIINGQTAKIEFQKIDCLSKNSFWVCFGIVEKRKDFYNSKINLKSTGNSGIEGLLWAKSMISEFVKFMKEKMKVEEVIIVVGWDDNRRRNVYARGLKNLGFYFKNLNITYENRSKKYLYRKF